MLKRFTRFNLMKRNSASFLIGIILNTCLILACISKFIVWDMQYFMASRETLKIWQTDFERSDYPSVGDTFLTLLMILVFGVIEWYLIKFEQHKFIR